MIAKVARKVTKREAATCQLETAIKLFFEYRDLISAHTLCCAADGILEGVYKNERSAILRRQWDRSAGKGRLRFSFGEEWEIHFKSEYVREGFRILNAAQNFFKHAEKDHDRTYEFDGWEQTGFRIFFAVTNYLLVFGEITKAMGLYFNMFALLHPKMLAEGNPLLDVISADPNYDIMLENLSPEKITAVGYSKLKAICPELFV